MNRMFQFVLVSIFLFIGIQAQHVGYPRQNHIQVFMPHNDASHYIGETAELFCDYNLSYGLDQPVTVTWKKGGFIDGNPIFRCKGYTKASRKCTSIELFDEDYYFRIGLGTDNPSLIISNLQETDNSNFWCEISVEGSTNYELEYDTRSVVIYLNEASMHPPKYSNVILYTHDVVAYVGETKTFNCICDDTTVYCDDVYWYKGPSSDGQFEPIYARRWVYDSSGRPAPIEEAYGDWEDRVLLIDESLQVSNLQVEDSGRYWCEFRAGFYKTGLNPNAIDAKSFVLEVI